MRTEFCRNCNQKILVMCFQGQDYCSENCGDVLKKKDETLIAKAELPLGHPYWGNICGGFGAPTECEHLMENGQKCGKSPAAHDLSLQYIIKDS